MPNMTMRDVLKMPDGIAKRGALDAIAKSRPAPPVAVTGNVRPDGSVESISVTIVMHTTTETNTGGSWRPKAKRAKGQRDTVARVLGKMLAVLPPLPVTVQFCRINAKALDEHDNLPSAFKHAADEICETIYGVKDNDPRVHFETPTQEVGASAGAVKITITRQSTPAATENP